MDEVALARAPADDTPPTGPARQPISGTYTGQQGSLRLELRLDLQEPGSGGLYRPLNLVSGDFYRHIGGGEWEYRSSFVVEHPYAKWGTTETVITGVTAYYRNLELGSSAYDAMSRQIVRIVIPLQTGPATPATITVQLTHWGTFKTIFPCLKTSPFLRTIDVEIDRIAATELPGSFSTHAVAAHPVDLPALELDVARAYQRAGIDLRVLADQEVFAPVEAGTDVKWDEDELHNAMEHHFSQWRNEPQWKLYLLIATHFRLYPNNLVMGIMYDSEARDPSDPYTRQGAAAFHSTMKLADVWGGLSEAEFSRNYVRTCVHELGHAFNLLHSFDKDRPDSLSWMNYPWRYPYGYNVPQGWNGTDQFWQSFGFEFDPEELRHLRHHALMEVVPGGASFGLLGHDEPLPMPLPPAQLDTAPVALYVRTRPERYLFQFAEPVSVELKLKNQTEAPLVVPDMLNPEFGLLRLYIRNPKGRVQPYRPLFKLCGEAKMAELPPGEKLFASVFVSYGAGGFYFEEPGEYQIWAVYGAGGLRLRSNALRIRVTFPQTPADEQLGLWTFGREQGHVMYIRGAEHLQAGNDQLREAAERFPDTNLARYVHYCFGNSQSHEFKNVVDGQVRPPQPEDAARELRQAITLLPQTGQSALDNLTHGRAVDLLFELYRAADRLEEAKSVLTQTARYFKRMEVKPAVIDDLRRRARTIRLAWET